MDLKIHFLGRISFEEAYHLQRELVEEVLSSGGVKAYLLLLEHEPVITLGRGADKANVLVSEAELKSRRIQLVRTDRGGDVTYHGPGQLVGYPIIHLPTVGLGARGYVRLLEECLITVLSDYRVKACRREGLVGVWSIAPSAGETSAGMLSEVKYEKIASIGVRIVRGVSMHGFALNITQQEEHERLLIPCGLRGVRMTSLAQSIGYAPPLVELARQVALQLGFRLRARRLRFVWEGS